MSAIKFIFLILAFTITVNCFSRKFLEIENCSYSKEFYKVEKCEIENNKLVYHFQQIKELKTAMVRIIEVCWINF